MNKKVKLFMAAVAAAGMFSCTQADKSKDNNTDCKHKQEQKVSDKTENFMFEAEKFSDLRVLRYRVPGFEKLSLNQKKLAYYLYEAALSGREIIIDQNYKHNLAVKRTLEAILKSYKGDRTTKDFKNFETYTKRLWFSNGIHHHYATDKFLPKFSKKYFAELVKNSPKGKFPLAKGQTTDQLVEKLTPIMFDPKVDAKRVNLDPKKDLIAGSANNLYEGVTQKEVEEFYKKMAKKGDKTPISYGLNSKLLKENGKVVEKKYRVGGMYTQAIEKIVYWLGKALTVAESDTQKKSLVKLIEFYKTGDLKTFDDYSILWVKDTEPMIDVTNGFIEVYGDAMGYRGAWQSVVSVKDLEATKRFSKISSEAPWFEKNSPFMEEHKKKNPQGVSYKIINTIVETGDCSPTSPLGVNLPNANWIRAEHGSKSVSLGNIEEAYEEASRKGGTLDEFFTPEQAKLIREHGSLAGKLHTGLHEVIGHGSGKLNEGVGTPKETLKNYSSALEEARADLVALYFLLDEHLVKVGLMPSIDVGKAEYNTYIVNGLMKQLSRLEEGANIEQSHMRNRQLIAKWCLEKGQKDKVIEKKIIDGKTFFVVNDYKKLRKLFGELLREVQRIKSEGDYKAGKALVETYGVKVDKKLHTEVLKRFKKLNLAAYSGFINPVLVAEKDAKGEIVDVKVKYPEDFTKQMLYYADKYGFLPTYN